MFQKLIQGFDTLFHSSLVQMSHGGAGGNIGLDMLNAEAHKVFSSFENNTSSSSGGGATSASGNSAATSGGGGLTGSSSSSASSPAHANSLAAAALSRSIYPYEIAPLVPINPNSVDILLFQQLATTTTTSGGGPGASGQSSSQQMLLLQQQSASGVSGSIQAGDSSMSSASSSSAAQQQMLTASQQQTGSGQFGALNSANSVYGLTAELLRSMLDFMQHDVRADFFFFKIKLLLK